MYILSIVLALSLCFCKSDGSVAYEPKLSKTTEEVKVESDTQKIESTTDSDKIQTGLEAVVKNAEAVQTDEEHKVEKEALEDASEPDIMPAKEEPAEYGEKLEQVDPLAQESEKEETVSEELYDALLRKYVSTDGRVNYKAIKSREAELDQYLDWLEKQKPSEMSRDGALAFWINAYNAFTIKLITVNYPLSSITDLDGGNPWDVKRIKLDGRTLSLNQIENEIIRPQFNEARIHFAVNCAAKSCPPLMNKAWTAEKIEEDLERQTRQFINNNNFNVISSNSVKISKIFEWYASDFDGIVSFLNRYTNTRIKDNASIEYLEYDWALNSL